MKIWSYRIIITVFISFLGAANSFALSWNTVNDFVYQLQGYDNDNLIALGHTKFDLAVIDYSADGTGETEFTPGQIDALKNGPCGSKLVLAYMSIGEAEDYRWYWQSDWTPGTPAWLGPTNPQWPGNYKVRYWETEWQNIIIYNADSYLNRIIAQGFDGVYLDIIDAYEYWEPVNPNAAQDMIAFVKAIADYARTKTGNPDFGVFPQNGEGLSSDGTYVQTTGIGKEDLWYNGNTAQPAAYTADAIANLDIFKGQGKLVLVIDYVTQAAKIDDFYGKAQAKGYVPYATVRNLDKITINPGHEPDGNLFNLSGRVTKSFGGLGGVTVNLTGSGNASATTLTDGNYTFYCQPNGNYTLTPTLWGYTFTPPVINLNLAGTDAADQDFKATALPKYVVSGKITDNSGGAVKGAAVTLANANITYTVNTNFFGKYKFKAPNDSYTLSAAKSGYTFSPASYPVTVNGVNQTFNFNQSP